LINGAIPNLSGSADVHRSMSKLDDVRNLFGMQNEVQLKFNTGHVQHKLITGLEFNFLNENYAYDINPYLPTIDLNNPVETAVEDELQFFPNLRGDVTNSVFAPYLIDQITFSDKLQLIAGLRYDLINFENSAENYLTDRNYNDFSPMLGLSYSPVNNITLFANLGRAYAPPSSQVVGGQEAERSQQFEIGVKQHYLDGRVNIDLSFYHLKKDNITIPSADGITKQLGDQTSTGIETELRIEPLRDWFLFVSYAYTDAELTKFNESVAVGQDENGMPIYMVVDRSGNKPEFSPEHIFNFWTTVEITNGLGVGGGIRYLSKQYININNVYRMDEALIVDFIAYYKLDWLKVSVNVKNITDKIYELRGFGATSVIPADPRAVFGKLNFYF
jgi:iron complex outermembrane receptor protein